ncbi:MAG TPA: Na+/H+ antiporter NhaA [Terriglobales bacterium]
MAIPYRTYGAMQMRLRESLITRTLVMPIQEFIHIQGISSVVLLGAAIIALIWANSPWHDSYHHVWEMELQLGKLQLPIHAWINDALMALFFFLVGMEIKHEIVHGELSDIRKASLPIFGALGGMVIPALAYMALNYGTPGQRGWGVPMATDIAFSLGLLGLVKGIPPELKIFLLTLAIADDIGSIIVIAFFYTDTLRVQALFVGAFFLLVLFALRRIGVLRTMPYVVLGILFWVAILRSGIHATIAGVILGFMVPTDPRLSLDEFQEIGTDMIRRFRAAKAEGDLATANRLLGSFESLLYATEAASERATRKLNDWVSFVVLPLFALSNAGVTFSADAMSGLLSSRIAWGIVLGLVIGKPLGIVSFSKVAVKLGIAQLPKAVNWLQMIAVGILAGIGFTVSIFISGLAFDDPLHLMEAKTAVLVATLIAGIAGYFALRHEARQDDAPPTEVSALQ